MSWRSSLWGLLGGVSVCAQLVGCSHNQAPTPVAAVVRPTPAIVTVVADNTPAAAPMVMAPSTPAPAPPSPEVHPPSTGVQQVSYSVPAATKDTTPAPAKVVVRSAEKECKPAFPRGESAAALKSSVDITKAACCAHADDYTWLAGSVDFSRLSNGWRLRYAGLDEADKYGGSVTLTGNIPLDGFKDGQRIRVQGHLSNPEDQGTSPAYHVDSFVLINGAQ